MNPHMHRRLAPASRDGRIGGSLYFFDQFMIVIALWGPFHPEIRVIKERPVSLAAPLPEPRGMVVKGHAPLEAAPGAREAVRPAPRRRRAVRGRRWPGG